MVNNAVEYVKPAMGHSFVEYEQTLVFTNVFFVAHFKDMQLVC